MRKFFAIALMLNVFACASEATINAAFQSTYGFEWSGGGNLLTEGSGDSTLVQLIWSSDLIADPADVGNANYVSGDDVWLMDYTGDGVTENGIVDNDGLCRFSASLETSYSGPDEGALPDLGYLYARIFQDDTVDSGDYYVSGDMTEVTYQVPGLTVPDSVELNVSDGVDEIGGEFSSQVVPEPGTALLLAVGAVVMAARRRRC